MTKEEGERWIRRLEAGNSDDAYRPSTNLSIVLRLQLHSGLKAARIYKMTVESYKLGFYTKGLKLYQYHISEEDDRIIQDHIREHKLGDKDLLITVTSRALRYKFENLVNVYFTGGRRPEIGDFYFAGKGIEDNKPMKRK